MMNLNLRTTLFFNISPITGKLASREESFDGFVQVQNRKLKSSAYKSIRDGHKKPRDETDYFLYPVDARFDSPHKLAAVLKNHKYTTRWLKHMNHICRRRLGSTTNSTIIFQLHFEFNKKFQMLVYLYFICTFSFNHASVKLLYL
ncbi:unnamed protein product [Cuscuta epithymum]|uniref:Uncharacterized protein n=1 Tax=Cuscuta epithymum TaxID=186058 RepID=A0AAV0EDV7_9ASTE|nr:unnamed protein product [Cuscuta epithymum]